MTILIKGAMVLAMDERHGAEPYVSDILVDGERIVEMGADLTSRSAHVLDARGRLAIPGLINAHSHSSFNLLRGRHPALPLEVFAIYAVPWDRQFDMPPRLAYLRTLLVGIESLKTGVTCVLDDVGTPEMENLELLTAVFDAYEDLGIRANCSGHVIDKPYLDTLPYADEIFPAGLHDQFRRHSLPTVNSYIEFSKEAIRLFHNKAGRLRYVLAPSGPQRCTEELLVAASEFSKRNDVVCHTHVLESKVQLVTGRELYGKTLVQHLNDLGALHDRVTLAHAIWVDNDDIAIMAESGCSVAHNPICNLKLGSGIAPLRKLLNAGVNIALGSDQMNANDSGRMFDVMHLMGILHNVTLEDYTQWPTAAEVLRAAMAGGAKSVGLEHEIGSLEPGKKADIVLLRLDSLNFFPLNDPCLHLVYAENGTSVEHVFVNGEMVVRDGSVTTVNEQDVFDEIRSFFPAYIEQQDRLEAMARELEPYFAELYRRCAAEELGVQRLLTQA